MKKVLLMTALISSAIGAQAASGQGNVSVWGGKCKAEKCTISGESGQIRFEKNGRGTTLNVAFEGCIKAGADYSVFGVNTTLGVEGCARTGYTKTTSNGIEVRVGRKHGWSYTYKKGDNIQVITNGNNTWAKIHSPSTGGRPATGAGW